MIKEVTLFGDNATGWQRSFYAFLAEKEQHSGSRRTVEGYSRMLQDFFGRLGKEPDLAVFIDFDALKAKLATDPTELEHLRKLGLGGVKSVGLASRLGASGVTDRLIVSAPGKRSGLLALIDPKPSKPKCLTKLPSSSVLVLGLQLDPDRIWKELRALADADVAEREGMDELERGMEEATGLRFVQDVLGAFEGEVTAALTLTPIGSHPAVAVMIETKDRKKARRFAAAITQHITSKTALESETMRVAETEVHFFRGTGNFFVPSPSWAFKDGYLLVTSSTSAMSELLQTSRDESIATSKVYADFRKAVPAARPYVLFVDIPRLGALGYDLLQNLLLRYRGLLVEFDAARLPTAGSIRRYLNPGGITLTNDDEVIRIDAATPFGLVSTTAAAAAYGALADKLVPKAPTHPARRPLNPWPRGTRRGQR